MGVPDLPVNVRCRSSFVRRAVTPNRVHMALRRSPRVFGRQAAVERPLQTPTSAYQGAAGAPRRSAGVAERNRVGLNNWGCPDNSPANLFSHVVG